MSQRGVAPPPLPSGHPTMSDSGDIRSGGDFASMLQNAQLRSTPLNNNHLNPPVMPSGGMFSFDSVISL